jgi:hypothetical protein
MITKNIDYLSSNNKQLIVSRFVNEKGDVEPDQANVSYGEFNDNCSSLYKKIHGKSNIKKEKGSSDDSFLEKDNFKNKVKFSFKEGNVLVLTCLFSFSAYSDGTPRYYPFAEGVEDSFFQEKSFKDVKSLEFTPELYADLQPSELKKIDQCSRLVYEIDIPIFGILKGKEIQFIEGPICGPNFQYYIEPEDVVIEFACLEDDIAPPPLPPTTTAPPEPEGEGEEGGGGYNEPTCDPPEPLDPPLEPLKFYGFFTFSFGP